jgi:hypothetical protein
MIDRTRKEAVRERHEKRYTEHVMIGTSKHKERQNKGERKRIY